MTRQAANTDARLLAFLATDVFRYPPAPLCVLSLLRGMPDG